MEKSFTMVSNEWIKDRNLSPELFRTLVGLKSYKYGKGGRVFPKVQLVADDLGISRSTVFCHIKRLKELGFITYKRRGFSKSNEYFFISPTDKTNDKVASTVDKSVIVNPVVPNKSDLSDANNTKDNKTRNKKRLEAWEKAKKELIRRKNPWLNDKNVRH